MRQDLTNQRVGTFKGPGETGSVHVIKSESRLLAEFISFEKAGTGRLMIEGLKLNQQPIEEHGEYIRVFCKDLG